MITLESGEKPAAILTIDDDGVMKSTTEAEEVGTNFFPWAVERIQRRYQQLGHIEEGIRFLDRRKFDPRAVEAVHMMHDAFRGFYRETGILIVMGSLTERPIPGIDRLRSQYESVGINQKVLPFMWGNPVGHDHTLLKPERAQRLKAEGIIHGHIENKLQVARNLDALGSRSYLRSSRATRALYHPLLDKNIMLIKNSEYEQAGFAFMAEVRARSESGWKVGPEGLLIPPEVDHE